MLASSGYSLNKADYTGQWAWSVGQGEISVKGIIREQTAVNPVDSGAFDEFVTNVCGNYDNGELNYYYGEYLIEDYQTLDLVYSKASDNTWGWVVPSNIVKSSDVSVFNYNQGGSFASSKPNRYLSSVGCGFGDRDIDEELTGDNYRLVMGVYSGSSGRLTFNDEYRVLQNKYINLGASDIDGVQETAEMLCREYSKLSNIPSTLGSFNVFKMGKNIEMTSIDKYGKQNKNQGRYLLGYVTCDTTEEYKMENGFYPEFWTYVPNSFNDQKMSVSTTSINHVPESQSVFQKFLAWLGF
ncbi:hypothetical protein DRQ25_12405 [Candidatus Fermentibacteria bacterium]|nr:MAG: hypothetical protein DRQ25_12405 [Candidatus Fermentibacteria bacterium]